MTLAATTLAILAQRYGKSREGLKRDLMRSGRGWMPLRNYLIGYLARKAYVERRTAEGRTKPEIIRCLKRYIARELYPVLLAATSTIVSRP